jgi:hypothetical protein
MICCFHGDITQRSVLERSIVSDVSETVSAAITSARCIKCSVHTNKKRDRERQVEGISEGHCILGGAEKLLCFQGPRAVSAHPLIKVCLSGDKAFRNKEGNGLGNGLCYG